ncbi:hypothetical protein LX32DRAFT_191798 [Colletotrichum zoysiae]|uniref:Uncharacterized protein n=1 Tax=Colletotrichum zoysiae TaxID=1216348 RepID=A0AAD9H553_9PEZI|nr:hypothetical protein LX32DRAFT_191798 [Colletotrichum zoysiae]
MARPEKRERIVGKVTCDGFDRVGRQSARASCYRGIPHRRTVRLATSTPPCSAVCAPLSNVRGVRTYSVGTSETLSSCPFHIPPPPLSVPSIGYLRTKPAILRLPPVRSGSKPGFPDSPANDGLWGLSSLATVSSVDPNMDGPTTSSRRTMSSNECRQTRARASYASLSLQVVGWQPFIARRTVDSLFARA